MPSPYPLMNSRKNVWNNSVLLLGSYSKPQSRMLMSNLAVLLAEEDYVPFLVEDLDRLSGEKPRQKVTFLISGVRFVIADDTHASGEILELDYCYNSGAVTCILRVDYNKSSWMSLDFEVDSRDMEVFDIDSTIIDDMDALDEFKENQIVDWAETRLDSREQEFQQLEQKY